MISTKATVWLNAHGTDDSRLNGKSNSGDLAAINDVISHSSQRYPTELGLNRLLGCTVGIRPSNYLSGRGICVFHRACTVGVSVPAQSRVAVVCTLNSIPLFDWQLANKVENDSGSDMAGAQPSIAHLPHSCLCYRLSLPLGEHQGFSLKRGEETFTAAGGTMHGNFHAKLQNLHILQQGSAELTWLATGIPHSPPPAEQNGFAVSREILNLDQEPVDGPLKQGEAYIVRLNIHAERSTPHVVIEDRLPAGLECENPLDQGSLAAQQHHQDVDARWSLLDDRALWFGWVPATVHSKGPLVKRYIVRATRSGHFTWPGTRIEAMYDDQRQPSRQHH